MACRDSAVTVDSFLMEVGSDPAGRRASESENAIADRECVLRKMDGGALPIREWVAERVTEH